MRDSETVSIIAWSRTKQVKSIIFQEKKVEGPFVLKRQLLKLVNAIVDLVVVGY